MFLRRFFNLEFGAVFFSILHFYLANYVSSFRLMDLDEYAAISQSLAYCALNMAILLSVMSIWLHKKEFFRTGSSYKISILLVLCLFLLMATKNIGVVLSLPIGLVLIGTRDRDIFQYFFYSSILLYSLTVLMYLTGFITGGDRIDTPLFDSKENVQQLYSLGFNNPNIAYKIFIGILLSALYLFGERKRTVLVLLLISVWLGILTGCTSGLLIAVVACFSFVLMKRNRFRGIIRKITPYTFAALTVLSFVVAVLFGSPSSIPNPVNDSLTGRPVLWNLRIENGSYINLIGDNDEYNANKYDDDGVEQVHHDLDNTFLYIMVHYGWVLYILYLWVYFKSAKVIQDEKILLVCFLLLLLFSVGRSDFISNIYLLFAVKYLAIYYFNRSKLDA